ncbi:MAG TPA: hypothetical protein VFO93_12785, partial [Hymenobacter sp.]|uniref:hypothetical protein n=1 Tax=Hymenobacter sp. TaxID=1898978 RepID=UPI002D7E37BA
MKTVQGGPGFKRACLSKPVARRKAARLFAAGGSAAPHHARCGAARYLTKTGPYLSKAENAPHLAGTGHFCEIAGYFKTTS